LKIGENIHAIKWMMIGLSVSICRPGKYFAEKRMPAHRMGRLCRFRKEEVDEWVKSGGADDAGKIASKVSENEQR
jgi:hypothetical protein